VRAYVLSRKGILISNPDVQSMTISQWLFEYTALRKKEREDLEMQIKLSKRVLVNVLGLNLIRPENADGTIKDFSTLTEEEKDQFLPLSAWVGRPELLDVVKEQNDKTMVNGEVHNDNAYEDLVASIDAAGGDMEPIIDKMFNIDRTQLKTDILEDQADSLGIPDISEAVVDVDGDF